MKKRVLIGLILTVALLLAACSAQDDSSDKTTEQSSVQTTVTTTESTTETTTEEEDKKPVIYLYPTEVCDVSVELNYNGELMTTYPAYNGKWQVTALPDGSLINKADGKPYSYLFWEGKSKADYDFSKGFVVKGEDTADFLQVTLSKMGLLPKEYNEFIVYWLPQMQGNAYNLIAFQGENYSANAELIIEPQPDSILRVFMAYKALDKAVSVEQPTIEPFVRHGFTVVEWGGCEVK